MTQFPRRDSHADRWPAIVLALLVAGIAAGWILSARHRPPAAEAALTPSPKKPVPYDSPEGQEIRRKYAEPDAPAR